MIKIIMIDNYDSFTYNIVHYIEKTINAEIQVFRNDCIRIDEIKHFDKIVLSPGPGLPNNAGLLKDIIQEFAPSKSILGICLGHQAIGEVFGGKLINLDTVFHGVSTEMIHNSTDLVLFRSIPEKFLAGRYHSWIVDKTDLPDCLTISCSDQSGNIMAMFHNSFDLRGVQFHPESILTHHGEQIIRNWLTY